MADFEIYKGAERPAVVWPFTSNGLPIDLTGASSVDFKARAYDGTVDVISGTGTAATPLTGGTVAYNFGTADTAQTGEYRGRFIVHFPTGEMVSPEFVLRIIDAAPGRGVPGARSTMASLIARCRFDLDDPPGPSQKFTDVEIQAALDRNSDHNYAYELRAVPEVIGGGSVIWRHYQLPYTDYEDGVVLRDGAGGSVSGYTVAADGLVTFAAATTGGTIYYATGVSYDVPSACADLLEKLIGRYSLAYDVSMDGQSMSRSQIVQQLTMRVRQLRSRGRIRSARLYRSDEVPAHARRW